MAMSIQFDTLDYAKKLETAGVPVAQAEVQAKALAEVLGRSVSFPGDLVTLERNIDAKIDAAETRLTNRIEKFEIKVDGQITHLKWMSGVAIALGMAVLAKLVLMH